MDRVWSGNLTRGEKVNSNGSQSKGKEGEGKNWWGQGFQSAPQRVPLLATISVVPTCSGGAAGAGASACMCA